MRTIHYTKNFLILGIVCLLLFCIPIVLSVFAVCQERKIDYAKTTIPIKVNDDFICLIDPHKYCSPLKSGSGGMCYIDIKNVNEKPARKGGRCEACGKYWYQHYDYEYLMSEQDWLKTCKEKDSYDYVNYYSPMGYGDL